MNIIFYDIETIANTRAIEWIGQRPFKAASNIKDPKKIEANIEAKRNLAKEKAALKWWTGQVVCITAISDSTAEEFRMTTEDEPSLLKAFSEFLTSERDVDDQSILIGKRSHDFDSPYLTGRYMANNISLPSEFKKRRPIMDIEHIWSMSRSGSQIGSLAEIAFGLDIDGKLADGGDVAKMWLDDAFKSIEDYCFQDTSIVREVYRRYMQ